MADFFQTGSIPTLHRLGTPDLELLEERLLGFSAESPITLVLPCHVDDLNGPAIETLLLELASVPYLHRIVIGIDSADETAWENARTLFAKLPQPVSMLWNDGPRIRALLEELKQADLSPGVPGKGRNLWLCCGLVLSMEESRVIAVHDCDILTYTRELPARLCYPVAHPTLGFDFSKGYSARFTDRLNGRVMRLLFTPLLRSLKSIFGDEEFLQFMDAFRYPLSGEVCFTTDVARRARIPSDWGVEVGMLAEVFRLLSPKAVCQIEIGDRYDHKHQDLSSRDPSKGLHKMAIDVAKCIFHTMAGRGLKLDRGVFATLLSAYGNKTEDMMRACAADADMNHLCYDRHTEELAVATFAESIRLAADAYLRNPLENSMIPSWNRVDAALPAFRKHLHAAVDADNAATGLCQSALSNY